MIKSTTTRYGDSVRAQAFKLLDGGMTVGEVARKFDVSPNSVKWWIAKRNLNRRLDSQLPKSITSPIKQSPTPSVPFPLIERIQEVNRAIDCLKANGIL